MNFSSSAPGRLCLLLILVTRAACEDPECSNSVSADSCPATPPGPGWSCGGEVSLPPVLFSALGEDCVFFLETSTRRQLSPREGCALESAVRNSGLRVVMLRLADSLDLADNTTCHIYHGLREAITFLHISPESFSAGTPLEGFFTGLKIEDSMNRVVHTADALRLLVIQRFGGFYSDTDVVFLRDVTHLKDVIASDQVVEEKTNAAGELLVGDSVTNALFHFSKGAEILKLAIEHFNEAFQSRSWASGGPDLLQRCLLHLCGFPAETGLRDIQMTRERFSREQCHGVQVLEPKSFFPFAWMQQSKMSEGRVKKEWQDAFSSSYAVHFFHSSSHSNQKIQRPKYYGARKPAYLTLALQHCPVAFWSKQLF